jgi:hypothetical protein
MGNYKSKLKCLILPAQSGKTRKVEDLITRFNRINELFGNNDDVNIWISANNKLLVHQTTSRIRKDLCSSSSTDSDDENDSNAVIKGKVFSWTSGTKNTNISARELAFEILNEVDMVVICAHSVRVRYLVNMINLLSNHRAFNRNINIWIDEADKSINIWSKYSELLSCHVIRQVTLVSATFNTVLKKYGSLNVIPYDVTHPDCYRRLKDCKRIIVDVGKSSPVEYVNYVLNKYNETLIKPGVRAFIPGDYTKESHESIAEMLISLGFAVVILNGTHKEIRIPGEKPIDLKPYLTISGPESIPEEFNTTLARMYVENKLYLYPFAITGFICVERGITFQCARDKDHNGFLFDYGIIPPIADKAEAYQTMARLFGNIGHFPDYKPCEIYTNSATFNRVQNQEEIAVHLARIVSKQNIEEVEHEHFRDAANYEDEKNLELIIREFNTLEESNNFLVSNGCRRKYKLNRDLEDERFIVDSTTKQLSRMSYEQVMKDLSGMSKSSGFDISNLKSQAGRTYICYRDINDPTSIVYITRIVKTQVNTIDSVSDEEL